MDEHEHIPLSKPVLGTKALALVQSVLESGMLTQGELVTLLEQKVMDFTGAQHAVAVNNGSSALLLAIKELGLAPGEAVLLPSLSFVAAAHAVTHLGGIPVFVDIDPQHWCISYESVVKTIHSNPTLNFRGLIVMPYAGYPLNVKPFRELADSLGMWVIEDACHALGGNVEGVPVGACRYSDAVVFSFHPTKIITAGEGGIICTNHSDVAQRMKQGRTLGFTREPEQRYNVVSAGYNFRLSDINAAVVISQWEELSKRVQILKNNAKRYIEAFAETPIRLQAQNDGHAHHLMVILGVQHVELLAMELAKNGIMSQRHYLPSHTMELYKQRKGIKENLKETELFYWESISLPNGLGLTEKQINFIANKVNSYVMAH